jgi:hypothetical protein
MYDHMTGILNAADDAAATDVGRMWSILRQLPIDDFLHVVYYKPAAYPNLFKRLPSLPDDQTQMNYVGESGPRLEQMTASFIRNFERLVSEWYGGSQPANPKILDYGCGWGRILRMMPRFTDVENLYGTDPMPLSKQLCEQLGVAATFAPCDPIPKRVAFDGVTFDIVYAFSVFTHLSEETAMAVLSAVRPRVAKTGTFIITIRPVEFWEVVAPRWGVAKTKQLEADHLADRYAFVPVEDLKFEGKFTYGDTSMSFKKLKDLADKTGWSFGGRYERSVVDPYQIVIPLKPT